LGALVADQVQFRNEAAIENAELAVKDQYVSGQLGDGGGELGDPCDRG